MKNSKQTKQSRKYRLPTQILKTQNPTEERKGKLKAFPIESDDKTIYEEEPIPVPSSETKKTRRNREKITKK